MSRHSFISIKRLWEAGGSRGKEAESSVEEETESSGEEETEDPGGQNKDSFKSGDADLEEAMRQAILILLNGLPANVIQCCDEDVDVLLAALKTLADRMQPPLSPTSVLGIASDAINTLETYCARSTAYLQASKERLESMVSVLSTVVADLSTHNDASVSSLQTIEEQLERVCDLKDQGMIRKNLDTCLTSLRQTMVHQQKRLAITLELLKQHVATAQKLPTTDSAITASTGTERDVEPESVGPVAASYIAAFRLLHADYIVSRFGEGTQRKMLSVVGSHLKAAAGTNGRLLRWKEASFAMFLREAETINEVRLRLADTIAGIGKHYVEAGDKSSVLSVAVDWKVFPQAQFATLEEAFAEVDAFLSDPTCSQSRKAEAPGSLQARLNGSVVSDKAGAIV